MSPKEPPKELRKKVSVMAIVYVQRISGPGSPIVGVYANPQPGLAEEAVDDANPNDPGYAALMQYRTPNRVPRPLMAIYTELNSLTGAQKTNIGADLFGASQKWATNIGTNRGAMFVIWALTQAPGVTAGQIAFWKLVGTALYVQDNTAYLKNPAFDSSINVDGSQPG